MNLTQIHNIYTLTTKIPIPSRFLFTMSNRIPLEELNQQLNQAFQRVELWSKDRVAGAHRKTEGILHATPFKICHMSEEEVQGKMR